MLQRDDGVDFNDTAFGQGADLHAGAGGEGLDKAFGVYGIYLGEVAKVSEVDGAAHGLAELSARGGADGAQVIHGLAGFGFDATLYHGPAAGI